MQRVRARDFFLSENWNKIIIFVTKYWWQGGKAVVDLNFWYTVSYVSYLSVISESASKNQKSWLKLIHMILISTV